MKVAHCPACGAIVEFHVSSSLVTICQYCHSAIARGDKQLEDLGKVADLVQTQSPLRIGLSGLLDGKSYQIVGRVQYQHPAGGVCGMNGIWRWGGNRWGWLAEAQGRFYVTFGVRFGGEAAIPTFEQLQVGQAYNLGPKIGVLKVGEKNEGVAASAEGEIPWQFRPGAPMRFADLYGAAGKFCHARLQRTGTAGLSLAKNSRSTRWVSPPSFRAEEPPQQTVKGLLCSQLSEMRRPAGPACSRLGSTRHVPKLQFAARRQPGKFAASLHAEPQPHRTSDSARHDGDDHGGELRGDRLSRPQRHRGRHRLSLA